MTLGLSLLHQGVLKVNTEVKTDCKNRLSVSFPCFLLYPDWSFYNLPCPDIFVTMQARDGPGGPLCMLILAVVKTVKILAMECHNLPTQTLPLCE